MIELEQVSVHFGPLRAVDDLSLCLPGASTTVLIGPSGCGKSTLLRLIAGLVDCDRGSVRIDGRTLARDCLSDVRKRMGYVIQEGGLFPHLSAADNVTLMARYLRWSRQSIAERMAELAELMHFSTSLLRRFPGELSGGQRQRVSLMRALMLDPDVLLLDEPLGALDPMIRYELQQELKDVFARLGKTVLLVTHDMAEAAFFGDNIVLLRAGRIVQQGSVGALLDQPAEPFVEQFINAQRSGQLLMRKSGS